MTRVLVTGANGHIGSNTVRRLLHHGHEAIPFVRPTSNLRGIAQLKLTCRFGDIQDYASLRNAMIDCEAVIHHATVYRVWDKNPDTILRPALEGARNLFEAAHECGVRRIVYTSSIAAVGYLRKPFGLRTAEDWNDDARSPYFIAKTRSEREAVRLSQAYDIPTIRICPGEVLGPYDYAITPSTKTILELVNKTGTTFESGTNYVHVQDVAEVHVLALTKGEPGSRFIVGGANLHLKDVARLITQLTGVKPDHFGLTGFPAKLLGTLMGALGDITGAEPLVTRELVEDVVGRYGYFDCRRTTEVFGIAPIKTEDVVHDAIRWLLFIGKIKPAVAERISSAFPPDPAWHEGHAA